MRHHLSPTRLLQAALPVALFIGCSTVKEQRITDRTESSRPSPVQQTEGFDTLGRKWDQPAAPVAVAAPAKAAEARPAEYSGGELKAGLVHLDKRTPASVSLGDEYACDLVATALADTGTVLITDTIPDGATLVRTDPPATQDGNTLMWRFPAMQKGESKNMRIFLKANKEGELASCATVTAVPLTCAVTMVGKPVLTLTKTGPETALLGSEVRYNLLVSNKGTTPARNVVVTDKVPPQLATADGQKELTFEVGDLSPNQSKDLPVVLKAIQRGRACNTGTAVAANTGAVNAEACTLIVQPGIAVQKTGDKEQFLTRQAKYQIMVTNTGDTVLTGVVVTDTAPDPMAIAYAEDATIQGNTAVWNIRELAAKAARTFNVALTSKQAGNYCNEVTVASGGLRDSAKACTLWKGVSALLLEVVDDPDPIQIGETTTFTIKVTNQGTADDNNIGITAMFAGELMPVSAQGRTVEGQKVTFATVPQLMPKQSLTYTISAKGAKTGDHRLKVGLTSDLLKTPVIEEESTHVY